MRKQERTACGAEFLRECLQEFINNVDMSYMTVENDFCAVTVAREISERTRTHAIGFDCGNAAEADEE